MPLELPDFITPLLDRPVAVLGLGVSGGGARALIEATGRRVVLYDAKGVPFTDEAARTHRLVVHSPGFPPQHPWLQSAARAGCTTLAEMDLGSLAWRGRVIAITGTNGKTTLTEFLAHALTGSGRRARVAGNIGHPLSALAAEEAGGQAGDIAVCEVSSFQAETLRHFRADATLWTNFAEDHLERHQGLEAYFEAKWRLACLSLANRFYAGSSVQAFALRVGRVLPVGSRVASEGLAPEPRLEGTVFGTYPQRENFELAAAWWRAEALPEEALYAAARTFRLGRHRLGKVGAVGEVTFWNDSKATNFHAVEAALASFGRPVLLIAGGKPKGGDIGGFARRIAPRVRRAFLIGQTAPVLGEGLAQEGVPCLFMDSIEAAVSAALEAAEPGDQVLLSPGFASFDQFRSYEDRGERFMRAVDALAEAKPTLKTVPQSVTP